MKYFYNYELFNKIKKYNIGSICLFMFNPRFILIDFFYFHKKNVSQAKIIKANS